MVDVHCHILSGMDDGAKSAVDSLAMAEMAIADGITREQAQKEIETISHEVLTNPVIEDYRVEFLD